ncbi:MAG: hypothetical protein GPJ54_09625 [Candidatus Heimdallarchaeota archaeon]|nr:hypothetical protein [Candidatus Heimdallarchaeota archaeon]
MIQMEFTIIIRKLIVFNILIILMLGNIAPTIGNGDLALNVDLSSTPDSDFLESQISISNVDDDEYLNGLNMFGLVEVEPKNPLGVNSSYLMITNMEGKIVTAPLFDNAGLSFSNLYWINETTILTNYKDQPMFWNVVTNVTKQFNFAVNFHDGLQYNPETRSFMILERFVKDMLNSTGELENMVVDRVREYSLRGDLIWSWDLSEFVNIATYFDNFEMLNPPVNKTIINTTYNATTNITTIISVNVTINATMDKLNFEGINYTDPIHANNIYWDTENRFVYVNLQHLNQFIKFNYFNKELIWIAGQNTDFKLHKANGSETQSLWYNSHDLNPIGNDEFLMFDNDYHNITDPIGNFTQSSIVKVKINPVNMTIEETFRWLGATSYSSEFWGGAAKLSNGNYLTTFGSTVHGNQSSPSHESFGGAAIEINPLGEKVWELRVPFNWGFNRLDRIVPTTTAVPVPALAVDVGNDIPLMWDAIFSNFPSSYEITLDDGIDLESGDWNNEDISYTLETDNLAQGDHIITLTLIDLAENEKSVATKITILLLATSKKDDSPFMNYFVVLNSLFITLIIAKRKVLKSI